MSWYVNDYGNLDDNTDNSYDNDDDNINSKHNIIVTVDDYADG